MSLARYLLAREPGPPPLPRAEIYRRLVRANLAAVLDNAFPVTRAILGDRWATLIDDFLDSGGPQTPLYREVPGDLVAWALVAEEPLSDLLHYEWLELVAARHPAEVDALPPADDKLLPNATMQIAFYARPVHTMSAATPDPAPFDAPSAYLVWRRPLTDEVVFQRVGLAIGRAFELALSASRAGAPRSALQIADEIARATHLGRDVVHGALEAALVDVRARGGASH